MNTVLMVVSIVLTLFFFIPLLIVQSIRRREELDAFHLNLAINIDYIWGALIFGADGHTVSAIVYMNVLNGNKKYVKYVSAINWVFDDPLHCSSAYEYEFDKKDNECQSQ